MLSIIAVVWGILGMGCIFVLKEYVAGLVLVGFSTTWIFMARKED